MIGAPLRMTDDDGAGAGVLQHFGRNIAGEGARRLRMAILRRRWRPPSPWRRRQSAPASVAGGQIIRSARPVRPSAPAIIAFKLGDRGAQARSFSSCLRPADAARSPCAVPQSLFALMMALANGRLSRQRFPRFPLCVAAGYRDPYDARPFPPLHPKHEINARPCFEVCKKLPATGSAAWSLAVLFGLIAISFAIWGIGDIFRGFGTFDRRQDRRHRNRDRAVPPELQRAAAATDPPGRTPDHRGPGARARPAPASARPDDRRSRARRECPQMRLGLSDAEIAKRITTDPTFRGLTGQFDRNRFEADHPAGRLQRRPLSSTSSAASLLRRQIAETHRRRADRAADRDRRIQNRYRNEERAIDYIALDREQAGEIPAPSPEVLDEIFRRAQGAVPRARISQGRSAGAVADETRRDGSRSPTTTRTRPTKTGARVTSRRSGARCSRSCFRMPRKRALPPRSSTRRRDVRANRGRARRQGHRHQSRLGDESRDARSRRRRRRLRAAPGQGQRAGRRAVSAPCSLRVGKIEPEKVRAVRRGRRRDQARARARARQGADRGPARQDRGRTRRRPAARRDRQEAQSRDRSASTRSTAPAAIRAAIR